MKVLRVGRIRIGLRQDTAGKQHGEPDNGWQVTHVDRGSTPLNGLTLMDVTRLETAAKSNRMAVRAGLRRVSNAGRVLRQCPLACRTLNRPPSQGEAHDHCTKTGQLGIRQPKQDLGVTANELYEEPG